MYKSKFIQHYERFTKTERALLRKWAASPLHTPNPALKQLIDYTIDLRSLSKRALDKERVFAAIYGDHLPYDDLKMRHLLSLGVQNLDQFVQFLAQAYDPLDKEKKAVIFYQDRHYPKAAQKKHQQVQQKLLQSPHRDASFYHHQYQLETLQFELQGTGNRSSQTNLQAILDKLNHHFVFNLLHWACTALTHQNVFKTTYEMPFMAVVLEQINQGVYDDHPTILLYHQAYCCLSDAEAQADFEAFKNLLLEHSHRLAHSEQKDLYIIAINYWVKQLNIRLDLDALKVLFELYESALEAEVLLEEGHLSHFTYSNISSVALRLKEFDWTKRFIQTYTPYLRPAVRSIYALYVEAKLAFAQQDYDQAQRLLLEVNYDDVFLNIDTRMMLLKIYYLQQEFDPLEALLTSLSRYLERQKMLSYHKDNYRNIIRLLRRLLYLAPYDTAGQDRLRQDIETAHPLTERTWLLEQLDQLS